MNTKWFWFDDKPRCCKVTIIRPSSRKKIDNEYTIQDNCIEIQGDTGVLFQLTDIDTNKVFLNNEKKIYFYNSEDECLDAMIEKSKEKINSTKLDEWNKQIAKDTLHGCIMHRRIKNLNEAIEFAY